MGKKIFIAATGQDCGKTTTSLSLLHLARQYYRRVGFIKPFGPKRMEYQGKMVDVDAALMAHVFDMDDQLDLMSPVVLKERTTRDLLEGKDSVQPYLEKISEAIEKLERMCDFLIIEGAGHSGVGSVMGLNNAQLAKYFNAPVLLVAGGGVGSVIDAIHLNLSLFRESGAEVRMIMPNKLIREKRQKALYYLGLAFKEQGIEVVGGYNYSPILANPTVTYVANLLKLELHADEEQARRIIHHVQVGAASTRRIVDLLKESSLLIIPTTRSEVLVMLATLYQMPEYQRKLAGLIVSGRVPLDDIVKKVLDDTRIPYMRTTKVSADVYTLLYEDVAKIRADDDEKIALIRHLAEEQMDFELIDSIF